MAHLVELVVHSNRNRRVVDRVAEVIRKAGGTISDVHTSEAADETHAHVFLMAVDGARMLPKVVHSVEAIPGVAVTAVTEPGTPSTKASRKS